MNVIFTYQPTEKEIKKVMQTYQIPRQNIHIVNGMNQAAKHIIQELKNWK